jgi:hypothetical protein
LEASASFTRYQVPIQSDNQSFSLGPYVDWQVAPTFHATVRGGPTFYRFDSNGRPNPTPDLNSYYLGLRLDHQLTDYINHSVGVRRDVQLGLNPGSDYLEQLTATYSFSWLLTSHSTVGAALTYEFGHQPLHTLGFYQRETFDRIGLSPGVSYRFSDHFTSSVAYSYWLRESNLPERNYTQNSVSFQLNYQF